MQLMARISLIFFFTLLGPGVLGQPSQSVVPWRSAKAAEVAGDSLSYAFAGGFNAPQWGNVDIDGDGVKDLVAFDRDGYRWVPFQRIQSRWAFRPDWAGLFPSITDWMVLVDYNCDGIEDVFCSVNAGIGVYKGQRINGQLSYTWALGPQLFLLTEYISGGGVYNLSTTSADKPGILDIDQDGDIDIITFGQNLANLEFHRNDSACGFDYHMSTDCWGDFLESSITSNTLELDACTGSIPMPEDVKHGGSSIALHDVDGNGKPDILLGDEYFGNLVVGFNVGTLALANIESQDTLWPSAGIPVQLPTFPAAYVADATNDGLTDIMVSPNGFVGPTQNNVWLYKNSGSATSPVWSLLDTAFLQSEMFDFGAHAAPALADFNTDGLPDLIVGTKTEVLFYTQSGTANAPLWQKSSIQLGTTVKALLGSGEIIPAAGDLDGDGDLDLVLGKADGTLVYAPNSGTLFVPQFTSGTAGWIGKDVGQNAAPDLHDIDGDGDNDLIIGNFKGNLSLALNTGSSSNPSFPTFIDQWGGIDVDVLGASAGRAAPRFYTLGNTTRLLVGSSFGGVMEFDSLTSILNAPPVVTTTIGSGNYIASGYLQTPFGSSRRAGRHQYLIPSTEISWNSRTRIEQLDFIVLPGNLPMLSQGFTVKLSSVEKDSLHGTWLPGGQEVFSYLHVPTVGTNTLSFLTPFYWDGHSDLLLEICFSKNLPNSDVHLQSSLTPYAAHLYGDATTYNSVTTIGCALPLLGKDHIRPNFTLRGTPAMEPRGVLIKEGAHNYPAVSEMNGDGYIELILGNRCGGLTAYKGLPYTIGIDEREVSLKQPTLFPNPANNQVMATGLQPTSDCHLITLHGSLLWTKQVETDGTLSIPVQALPNGVYFVRNGQHSLRLVVFH